MKYTESAALHQRGPSASVVTGEPSAGNEKRRNPGRLP